MSEPDYDLCVLENRRLRAEIERLRAALEICRGVPFWTGPDGEPGPPDIGAYLDQHAELERLRAELTEEKAAARDMRKQRDEEREERDNQQDAIKLLVDTLKRLVDIQNGPPLIRDTQEWNEIMAEASDRLMRRKAAEFYRGVAQAAQAAEGGSDA